MLNQLYAEVTKDCIHNKRDQTCQKSAQQQKQISKVNVK